MDKFIEEILEEFNKPASAISSLCPYCTKLNNCTLKNTAKTTDCTKFSLNPEATKFSIGDKQFMVIELDFTCCSVFDIELAIQTFKQLYPREVKEELFYFVRGYNPLYYDEQRKREIEQKFSEVWTLFTACLSCSAGCPDGQSYIFVRI